MKKILISIAAAVLLLSSGQAIADVGPNCDQKNTVAALVQVIKPGMTVHTVEGYRLKELKDNMKKAGIMHQIAATADVVFAIQVGHGMSVWAEGVKNGCVLFLAVIPDRVVAPLWPSEGQGA